MYEKAQYNVNNAYNQSYILNLSLADVLKSSIFGTLIAIAQSVLHFPLHLPGHSSIYWMGILLVGKALIPRFGSGIIMGIISGTLAIFFGLGKEGIFVFVKYFAPGLLIDVLVPFFGYKLNSFVIAGICGAFISLSKLGASILIGMILKVPLLFLTIGLGYVAFFHAIFGAIGGILAALIIRRLKPIIDKTSLSKNESLY
jgi:hypothetical protein